MGNASFEQEVSAVIIVKYTVFFTCFTSLQLEVKAEKSCLSKTFIVIHSVNSAIFIGHKS